MSSQVDEKNKLIKVTPKELTIVTSIESWILNSNEINNTLETITFYAKFQNLKIVKFVKRNIISKTHENEFIELFFSKDFKVSY